MKRKKTIAVAAGTLAASAALLTGCGRVATLYGPPPASPEISVNPENNINIPAPLYGPPEMLLPPISPEDNIPEDVYGPPMYFEDEENVPEEPSGGEQTRGEQDGMA